MRKGCRGSSRAERFSGRENRFTGHWCCGAAMAGLSCKRARRVAGRRCASGAGENPAVGWGAGWRGWGISCVGVARGEHVAHTTGGPRGQGRVRLLGWSRAGEGCQALQRAAAQLDEGSRARKGEQGCRTALHKPSKEVGARGLLASIERGALGRRVGRATGVGGTQGTRGLAGGSRLRALAGRPLGLAGWRQDPARLLLGSQVHFATCHQAMRRASDRRELH